MNQYMKVAKELAAENLVNNHGGPFGAVIVKEGEIVGKGANSVLVNHDPTAHAEVTAIRDACKNLGTHDLTGCTLYTTSYPCPMCLSATIWSNIKSVYYGNTVEDTNEIGFRDDFIYKYLSKPEDTVLSLQPMDREDTLELYRKFMEKQDRTMY